MKIGIIQASSQADKNKLLEDSVKAAVVHKKDEVINFGVNEKTKEKYSYVQIALCISLLLESKAVDFIVTGCSSGQGMMLACNSLPGVLCGYVENVSDAYLFGRINDGNAVSYPLGLNFGWAAELNLKNTMKALLEEPFGIGYPKEDAERKKKDTQMLKTFQAISKKSLIEVLPELERSFVESVLHYDVVFEYICKHGTNKELIAMMKKIHTIK